MNEADECITCSREITHPICAGCNARHFFLWLNDKKLNINKRVLMEKIKKSLFIENGNHLNCIICHNGVYVCSYCFFSKVESMIHHLNLPKPIKEDFGVSFNYEIYSDYPTLKEA